VFLRLCTTLKKANAFFVTSSDGLFWHKDKSRLNVLAATYGLPTVECRTCYRATDKERSFDSFGKNCINNDRFLEIRNIPKMVQNSL
jgi:hypothetical protein